MAKRPETTTADGYEIQYGMRVRIAPAGRKHDKGQQYGLGQVITPGPVKSLVKPDRHKVSEWIENIHLRAHKSACLQAGHELVLAAVEVKAASIQEHDQPVAIATEPEPDMAVQRLDIPLPTPKNGMHVEVTADDFDALAEHVERLRKAALAKLMKLETNISTAKTMLSEAEAEKAKHIRQCKSLGIDIGEDRE